jgi:hypothetical protein
MTEETVAVAPPPMNVFARFVGIITSPKATFEAVVRVPKVIGMLALIALLTGASQGALGLTERGRQAQLDFQVQQMERMGMTVTDQMYESMQSRAKYSVYTSFIGTFVFFPIAVMLVAGILYAIFNAIMGGTADYKQVMAVVTHAWVVPTLGAVFGGVMNFIRGSISTSVANLGMLLPMLPERSFAANLAAAVDVFQIWWIITLAIGLGVLYKRKTANIATGLFIVWAVIVVCVSYFFSR